MRYIIIGSGIAGITAAKTLRQHDPEAQIRVYTHDMHPFGLYARKDMARRLAEGSTQTAMDTLLMDSETDLARAGITLVYQEILRVFPHLRVVLEPRHVRRSYDRLLIASGATPQIVDAPGIHLLGVHQMRIYEDLALIEGWMEELQEQGAVVIGGGILGIDMAYALNRRGVPTTLVVREAVLGTPMLPEVAGRLLEARLRQQGVNIVFNQTVDAYLSQDGRLMDAVRLSNGEVLPARMALCAVGVRPATDFLDETGLDMDETSGALVVDDHMQTNQPQIYAAGSCAMVNGEIVRNWSHAAEQGRVAALNMLGEAASYQPPVPGDLHAQIADLPLAYFGRRTPTGNTWAWQDENNQLIQVNIEDGRIVGATLIGGIAVMAGELLERMYAQTPVTADTFDTLLQVKL